ncbi:MAG: response regulator [Victivallaceae bacterium]|nr:response regulator [Victivallaceae bacterium]
MIWVIVTVFLIPALFSLWIFQRGKNARDMARTFRAMPFLVAVIDRNYHVRLIHDGALPYPLAAEKMGNPASLKGAPEGFAEIVDQVFKDGCEITAANREGSLSVFRPFPGRFRGRRAVIWILMRDVEALEEPAPVVAAKELSAAQRSNPTVKIRKEAPPFPVLLRKELSGFCRMLPVGAMLRDAADRFRVLVWNEELARMTGIPASRVEQRLEEEIPWPEHFHMENGHGRGNACGDLAQLCTGSMILEKRRYHIYSILLPGVAELELQIFLPDGSPVKSAKQQKGGDITVSGYELRTPLNTILGICELLRGETLKTEEEKRTYLDSIRSSALDLSLLADAASGVAAICEGRCIPVRSDCTLGTLAGEVKSMLEEVLVLHDAHLEIELPVGTPPLRLDRELLRKALVALTMECLRADGYKAVLEIRAFFAVGKGRRGHLEFQIAADKNAFSEAPSVFYQYASMLAGLLDGVMTGEEIQEGMQRRFKLTLPDVEYGALPEQPSINVSELPPSATIGRACVQQSVLLVDDIPMNLLLLSNMFRKLGVEPETADSGSAALAWLDRKHFDLVLTDLWMEGMNGEDLACAIRARGDGSIRLGAVTADARASESFDMALFDYVLSKPLTLEKLERFLRQDALSGSRTEVQG